MKSTLEVSWQMLPRGRCGNALCKQMSRRSFVAIVECRSHCYSLIEVPEQTTDVADQEGITAITDNVIRPRVKINQNNMQFRGNNFTIFKFLYNKKAVLPQGNRAMPQVFFSVEVRQQHSLQV